MSDKDKPTGRELAWGCGWWLVGLPISTALAGLAWLLFWGWFVEPLGAPVITYWHALGLACMGALLKSTGGDPLKEHQLKEAFGERGVVKVAAKSIFVRVLRWPLAIFFGWLVHLAMTA